MVINGYNTSNDYEVLFKLMREQNIICYIDSFDRDVCEAIFRIELCPFYELVSRGFRHFSVNTKEEFIEKCERHKVWFVLPMQSNQTTLGPSLLDLFAPICFNTPEDLITKANELDVKPYNGASIVTYFIHVAGKLCRSTNTRLFYLKAPYSVATYESLLDHNFKIAFGKKNVYLGSNGFHGSLLIIEIVEGNEHA